MGFDTNTTNRLPLLKGTGVINVKDESGLGIASGGVITLEDGKLYFIEASFSTANRLEIPAGASVRFKGRNERRNRITYTGTDTFISNAGDPINSILMRDISITNSNGLATFMNLVGGATGDGLALALFERCDFNDFDTIGLTEDFFSTTNNRSAFGAPNGWTIKNISDIRMDLPVPIGNGTGTQALTRIIGTVNINATIQNAIIFNFGAESGFFISPVIGLASVINIQNSPVFPGSTYFESGDTGSITAFADASIGATAITSVSSGTAIPAGGNYARFNHAGTDVFVGQRVVTSTFTPEATYNQTLLVTVTGAGFFEGNIESTNAPIAFTNDDTGSYLSNSVTVTSTAHAQSDGQALLINGTIAYDGGFTIYNALTNTYQINVGFATAETVGTWDTGSLTQKDKRLNLNNNGDQQDSMNVAFGGMNENAGATTIASVDTYQAMDFNTVVEDPSTERWTLIDVTNGVFRYDGIKPVTGSMIASLTVVKSGSTEFYRFTDSKNGAIPDFATKAHLDMEVKTTKVNATLIRPISVVPGDTIQVVGAGDGTTNAITITDFFIQMIF